MKTHPIADQIINLDARILLAASRRNTYRDRGLSTSVIVQQGVIDRLLDERLDLMRERDR